MSGAASRLGYLRSVRWRSLGGLRVLFGAALLVGPAAGGLAVG